MIIGDMEIRLRADIARLQRDMDQARQVVGGAMAQIGRAVTGAMGAIAALGVGLSAAAFAGWIKGAIDAADATDELVEKTGLLHKEVAGLQLIFGREGVGGDAMIASLGKLSKAVVDGNAGLSALGIRVKDAGGSFRTTKDVLYDVADQFAAMDNGAQKTAVAMEIFGKSGAALIPMLNGGSQGMRDMADMAQSLGLVIDEKTAKSAGDFNDTLFLLSQGSQGVARGLAAELLPTLTNLAGSFLQSMTDGNALARTGAVLSAGLKTLYTVGGVVVETFKTVGNVIGALAAGITNNLAGAIDVLVKVSNGDFKGAWDSMKKTVATSTGIYVDAAKDIGASWKSMGGSIAQAWKDDGNEAVLAAAKQVKAQKDVMGNQKQREEAEKKAAAARDAASKAADKFIETQEQEIAQVGLAADQIKKLAAARAASLAPTEEQRKKILELALALDVATKAHNEKTEAEKAALAATAKADEALYAATAGVWDQVAAMEKQVELYGLTEDQVLRLQRTKLQADLAAADGDEKKIAALTLQIQGTERLIELNGGLGQKKADTKMSEDMLAEQKKSVEKYNDIFSKGFADMLNNGKAGWSSFTKSLTTTFKTTVADQIYKMFAQPFVMKLVASLLGVTGTGAAGAAQSLGGAGGVGGLFQTGKGIYDAISTGFTGLTASLGTGLVNLGSMLGSSSLGAFGAGVGSTGIVGAADAAGLYAAAGGTGSGAAVTAGAYTGAAVTAAAGIAAGVLAGRALSGGYSAFGGSGNSAVNTGTAVGAVVGSIVPVIGTAIGALIGGLIGGATNRLFGMRPKTVEESGLYGELGPGGASVNTYSNWTQKGGVFRSDKAGTDTAVADMETVVALGSAYKSIIGVSREYATVLGASADSITSRSQLLNIELGKDAAENGKAISDFFVGVSNAIATELIPGLDKFALKGEGASATLERLAGNYVALDAMLGAVGTSFGAVGLDSLVARERLISMGGGLQKLGTNLDAFAQNFLTDAERIAPVAKAVNTALADMGYAAIDTRAEFRDLVLGQSTLYPAIDKTTEAGAKQFAQLLELQGAFAAVYPAIEATTAALDSSAERAAEIAAERADLQKQYDQAFMSDLEKERAAVAASNVALFDSLQGRLAEKAAIDAAAQAVVDATAARVATEKSIQADIDALVKASLPLSEQRALEVAGMASSTLALYERREALQAEAKAVADAKAASEKATADAKAAADALAGVNKGYQGQIDAILRARMDEATGRAFDIKQMDASTVALYDHLHALQAEDKAATAAAEAIKNAQDSAALATKNHADAVEKARADLASAYERESTALQGAIEKAQEFAKAMRSFSDSLKLGDLSTLSPEQKYAEAQRQFANATPEQLQGASTALLEASKAYNSNNEAYARDYEAVQKAIGNAAVAADFQVMAAQAQLGYMAQQVAGIAEVNQSVLSMSAALGAYKAAVAAPVSMPAGVGGAVGPLAGMPANVQNGSVWSERDFGAAYMMAHRTRINGSHENGLWSVPGDGYIAELHDREAVLTAPQADLWRAGQGGDDSATRESNALLTEVVEQLRQSNESLEADKAQRAAMAKAAAADNDALRAEIVALKRKVATA